MKALKINCSLKVLLVSFMLILYFMTVVFPFADNYGFFSGNNLPQSNKLLAYFLLTTPIFIAYLWFLCANFKKIAFLKSIIYPIIIYNFFLGVFICLLIFGGAVLWILVFAFPIIFIVLVLSFIVGVVKDIKYIKMHKGTK